MLVFLALAALVAADVATHRYKDGEEVILWTNKGLNTARASSSAVPGEHGRRGGEL